MSTQSRIRFHNMKICRTRECAKKSGNGKSREPQRILGYLLKLTIVCALFQTASAKSDDDSTPDSLTGSADEKEELVAELNERLEDAGVLNENTKIEEADVTFANKEYTITFDDADFKDPDGDKTWKDTLKTEDEELHGFITDGKITATEFETLTEPAFFDFENVDNWMGEWFVIAGGVVVVGIICYFAFCRNSGGPSSPMQTTTSPHGHGNYGYNVGYRRRMAHTPVAMLSKEIRSTTSPTLTNHEVVEKHDPVESASRLDHGVLPGSMGRNIWWALPLSCITQIFWIYVVYRIYKACKSRCSKNQPQEELREITVRR